MGPHEGELTVGRLVDYVAAALTETPAVGAGTADAAKAGQGCAQTWTCWFPVGDCAKSLGGQLVLSCRLALLPPQIVFVQRELMANHRVAHHKLH